MGGENNEVIHLPNLDDAFEAALSESAAAASTSDQHSEDISDHNKKPDTDVASSTDTLSNHEKPKPLKPKEQARLASLKSMLDASNARYKQATRNRQPVFAAGLEVKVLTGEHTGKIGVVLDADYIDNRALISLPDQESPHWLEFKALGHSN